MENLPKEQKSRGVTLAEKVRNLEKKQTLLERSKETEAKKKTFSWPFKWRMKFNQGKKKINENKMLVIFLNKKNEIEPPKFMPIFDGNMIVWNNKPYEFDPRAIWRIKGIKGTPMVYLIKEIDRRPVRNKFGKIYYADAATSNLDVDEVRKRGDSTESDEFLIKAAIKAQTVSAQKKAISWIGIAAIVGIVGLVVWLLFAA